MKNVLGKGLEALIPQDIVNAVTDVLNLNPAPPSPVAPAPAAPAGPPVAKEEILRVPLNQLHPNPKQPRKYFSEKGLKELSASLAKHGILEPLIATPDPAGGFEIIIGERRWRAGQMAQVPEAPVILKTGTELERFQMAMVENLQREALNPLDQAAGYQRMIEEFHMTQEDIAAVVSKDRTVVANTLRLLQLPEAMKQALLDGKISASHGRALAGMDDPAAQASLFQRILDENLPVRATEQAVAAHKQVTVKGHARKAPGQAKAPEVKALETDLQQALGRKVDLQPSGADGKKGWLKLEYYSLDDLDRLTAQLKAFPPMSDGKGAPVS